MSCAILIPTALIILFILFYVFVLRPARMSREETEEATDTVNGSKSDIKMADFPSGAPNPITEKPKVIDNNE
jgi:hypothetical protein